MPILKLFLNLSENVLFSYQFHKNRSTSLWLITLLTTAFSTPLIAQSDDAEFDASIRQIQIATTEIKKLQLPSQGAILLPNQECVEILRLGHSTQSVDIYSVDAVQQALQKLDKPGEKSESGKLISFYQEMIRRGGKRLVIGAPTVDALKELMVRAPNHKEVARDIIGRTRLTRAASEPMQLEPMLLLGPPGVGKTHFASALAKIIGTQFKLIPMSSLTAGWILSGASSQWKAAKPGYVASTLIEGTYANSVIVIDEIDKASGSRDFDPMGALYTLLEKDTSTGFIDEFIDIPVNASRVMWVLTANDESRIPEPILNRMNVYVIPKPNPEEVRIIAQNIYAGILSEHPAWPFESQLSSDTLDKLSHSVPREIRRLLMRGFATAFEKGHHQILPDDLPKVDETPSKPPIGFIRN